MGFRNGAYAKVWKVEQGKGRFTNVRLSVSRKNKDTDSFEQEFSGFCMFIGTAHVKAAMLKGDERIKLVNVDVSNSYDKDSGKTYTNFKVFDFEMQDGSSAGGGANRTNAVNHNPVEGDTDEEECPF